MAMALSICLHDKTQEATPSIALAMLTPTENTQSL
jgi:hypothetical protein